MRVSSKKRCLYKIIKGNSLITGPNTGKTVILKTVDNSFKDLYAALESQLLDSLVFVDIGDEQSVKTFRPFVSYD